ncbi:DUF4351 domain-containing protein, partial [Gloeocapsa sp. PCC 73106]|uniref:DUF4351 domain-containing protein n=1 Tax=Gloeocapsa sp. PCC 73106 TaxID=102232 RepID=UPI0002AC5E58
EGKAEGKAEGKREERINLISRILNRKLGNLAPEWTEQITRLTTEQLETLVEALLDFNSPQDLINWLQENSIDNKAN